MNYYQNGKNFLKEREGRESERIQTDWHRLRDIKKKREKTEERCKNEKKKNIYNVKTRDEKKRDKG